MSQEHLPGALADPSAARLVEVLEPYQEGLELPARQIWEDVQRLCEVLGKGPSSTVPITGRQVAGDEIFKERGASESSTPETAYCDVFGTPHELSGISSPTTPPCDSASSSPIPGTVDLRCPVCGHVPKMLGDQDYRKGHLKKHMKIHTSKEERRNRHRCKCGSSFVRSDGLRKHRKICKVYPL